MNKRTILVAIALAGLGSPALAQGQPAEAPATRPAAGGGLADMASYGAQLATAVELTPVEQRVMEAVRDRTDRLEEAAFYVMLGVAKRAPAMDAVEWEHLDTVSYANLLRDPNHYRARPLQMKVRAWRVGKRIAGLTLTANEFFPKGTAAWQIDATCAGEARSEDKPLQIYSVADPTPLLGQPDEVKEEGTRMYKQGPELRAAGLFYKVCRLPEQEKGLLRDYPVLMAWQFEGGAAMAAAPATGGGMSLPKAILYAAVVGLGMVFIFFRLRAMRQKKQATQWVPPTRLEREARRREAERQGRNPDEIIPVDPGLAAAAKQYLQEKGEGQDGADRRR